VVLGTRPFRAALDEKLLLARYFHGTVAQAGFETGPEPDLSVVTYRWAPGGVSLEEANRMNQRIVEGVRRDGRVFISSTLLDDRFTLRLAILAFRSHLRTVDTALAVLREQAAEL
jgi:glutamate/tyrosine decarboxylase-like PLP-dependent enzyme